MTAARRDLVLVAGPRHGGLRTTTGALRRAGLQVPQPELPLDRHDRQRPGQSRWVVAFHQRLVGAARTLPSDTQPAAWLRTGLVQGRPGPRDEARTWLAAAFGAADRLVVADPLLGWFLPLWQQAAADLDATTTVVVPVRHPAEVVAKGCTVERPVGGAQHLLAGWVNLMTGLEARTRDVRRVFVSRDTLLHDPGTPLGQLAAVAGLPEIAVGAREGRLASYLARQPRCDPSWNGLTVGDSLRGLASATWDLFDRLTDADLPAATALRRLDEARAEYAAFYATEEALVHSSVTAAAWRGRAERRARTLSGG